MYALSSFAFFVAICAAQQLQDVTAIAGSAFQKLRIASSKGGKATCVEGTLPVRASAQNAVYEISEEINQMAITQMFVSQDTAGAPKMMPSSMATVSGTYDIHARLCMPSNSTSFQEHDSVQLLSHGIGFDSSYWDFAEEYSYVDVAAAAGKVTFSYDRLGTGASSKPDPIKVVQVPLESAILLQLVKMLKTGQVASTSFQRVIGVGHSFGSALTVAAIGQAPTTFDGIVLTGFSLNMTGQMIFTPGLNFQIAAEVEPLRFAGLPNGYIVDGSVSANQFGFFHYPGFPASNLQEAERSKGAASLGELLGLSSTMTKPSSFTGPVDVVNGEFDLPFCAGDCKNPVNLAQQVQPMLFPQASETSTTFLAPQAGHGLNLHYSAAAAFDQIQHFINDNGL